MHHAELYISLVIHSLYNQLFLDTLALWVWVFGMHFLYCSSEHLRQVYSCQVPHFYLVFSGGACLTFSAVLFHFGVNYFHLQWRALYTASCFFSERSFLSFSICLYSFPLQTSNIRTETRQKGTIVSKGLLLCLFIYLLQKIPLGLLTHAPLLSIKTSLIIDTCIIHYDVIICIMLQIKL